MKSGATHPGRRRRIVREKNISALIVRGFAQLREGNLESAISDFNDATEINPCAGGAFKGRALCYAFLNQAGRALDDLNRAIATDDSDAEAYLMRSQLYASVFFDLVKSAEDRAMALKLNPKLMNMNQQMPQRSFNFDPGFNRNFRNPAEDGELDR